MLSVVGLPTPLDKKLQEELLGFGTDIKRIPEENRETIINRNLRLVARIVLKNFQNTGFDDDDLFQIGSIGLINAVRTYNPSKKIKFQTYAATCISNEILMHMRISKRHSREVYFQDAIMNNQGDTYNLEDVLPDTSLNFEEKVISELIDSEISEKLDTLDQRLRFIIINRILPAKEDKIKQEDIAKILNISQSFISRLEIQGRKKLEKLLKDYI